ncbi:MAG: P1 family peptidase [Frankiaceae bacterium]|nr:P1 family peptidase [Frankiaceae bacterium]MBV9944532.1 P1 family peptidase [Solirubrobacterales bacterium]
MGDRARNLGLGVGSLPTGPQNAITDVPDVRVGVTTVIEGDPGGSDPVVRSGVTAILPHPGNLFRERVFAGVSAFNGYGMLTGSLVIDEWGLLNSPIVIVDTTHIGMAYDTLARWLTAADPTVGDLDVAMPVVTECDDGFLNDNRSFGLQPQHVVAALDGASSGHVPEGAVGSGTGTQLFEFKGGVGTSSRIIEIGGEPFTVGVLVNTNYGHRHQLRIHGAPVGEHLRDTLRPGTQKEGSCIVVIATDVPLHPGQLRRVARRADAGLARTGSCANDGSGEISLAFSTANHIPREGGSPIDTVPLLRGGQFWTAGAPVDLLFEAVADATEEASLNALFSAQTMPGRDGHVLHAIPLDQTLEFLEHWHPPVRP